MINDLMPIDRPEHTLSGDDEQCLRDVRDVLARHGRLDRFGVTLLHKHFDLAPGERLIEMTDTNVRTQTVTVMKDTEIGDAEVIETAWRLYPDDSRTPLMGCIMGCFGGSTAKCEYRDHTGVKN